MKWWKTYNISKEWREICDIHWEQGCLLSIEYKFEGILEYKGMISLQIKVREWKADLNKWIKSILKLESIAELKISGWLVGFSAVHKSMNADGKTSDFPGWLCITLPAFTWLWWWLSKIESLPQRDERDYQKI